MELFIILYSVLVAGLVWAELGENRVEQITFKPLAALGFCALAISAGALSSIYGQLILAALVFCTIGDVALLSRTSNTLFQLGMAAFAIGHVIYSVAFIQIAFQAIWAITALLVMSGIGLAVYRYLRKSLSADMHIPVRVYMFIITAMVVTAWGSQNQIVILAAMMFAISDMFVARDRFVSQNPRHALVISPLYFGAQALFALGIAFA